MKLVQTLWKSENQFYLKLIENKSDRYFKNKESYEENSKALHTAYKSYIDRSMRLLIGRGHFSDISIFLKRELKQINTIGQGNKSELFAYCLQKLLRNNILFPILDKDDLDEIIDDYKTEIDNEVFENLSNSLNFDIEYVNLNALSGIDWGVLKNSFKNLKIMT